MSNQKKRIAHKNRKTPVVVNVSVDMVNAVKVNTETIIDMDIWTDMVNAFGNPFAKTL